MDDHPTILIDPTVTKPPFDRAAHCRNIGPLGGKATRDKYAPNAGQPGAGKSEYFRKLGEAGFKALCERYNLTTGQARAYIAWKQDPDRKVRNPLGAAKRREIMQTREWILSVAGD